MNKCKKCGAEKTKLTLNIEIGIIQEAKKRKINISKFLETKLLDYFLT